MQKIFSQEIRFRDQNGKEFGEWEEKRLEEVTKVVMGVSPSSGNYNNEKNGMLLIQGNADIKNRVSNPRQYTTQITKECNSGDILMSVRAPVGEFSRCIHNACIGRGICAIQSKCNVNNDYLFHTLVYTEVLWNRFKQGSTFESVNTTDIRNFKLKIPTLAEQTKIAQFLSALDRKIAVMDGQIEKTKEWKKGLLQRMFV